MSDIKQVSIMVRNMLDRDGTPSRKEAADALAVAVGEVLDQIEQLTQTNKELEEKLSSTALDLLSAQGQLIELDQANNAKAITMNNLAEQVVELQEEVKQLRADNEKIQKDNFYLKP